MLMVAVHVQYQGMRVARVVENLVSCQFNLVEMETESVSGERVLVVGKKSYSS